MKKRLLTLALTMLVTMVAWAADVNLTSRDATNELFRLERLGDKNKYFISSGSFIISSSIGDPYTTSGNVGNTWGINADDRYIGFTLPTALTFQAGDIIKITGGMKSAYNASKGLKITDATSAATFTQELVFSTNYSAYDLEEVTYTIQETDVLVGQHSLYVYRYGENAYVQSIVVMREGADDLVPNSVSNKSWDLHALALAQGSGKEFPKSIVYDNLLIAGQSATSYMKTNKQMSNPDTYGIRIGAAAVNEFDFLSMQNAIALMVDKGKRIIAIEYVSNANIPDLKIKNGSTSTTLTGTATEAKDNRIKVYYTYDFGDYALPLIITQKSNKITTISEISVAPESISTPIIEETATEGQYKITPGVSNAGPAVTVTTYYTVDGTVPTSGSTPLPNDGIITATSGQTIKAISISSFDAQSEIGEKTIEASSDPTTNYTLTTNIVGNGTITVNDAENTGSYVAGANLVLKATPNGGSLFLNWSDGTNVLTNAPTYTIESLSASTTLIANFKTVEATVPVILTAGQSNTDGRAQNDSIPYYIKSQGSEYPNVYWSYGNATNDKVTGTFDKFWPACDAGDGRWAYDAVVYYHLQKTLNGSDLYVIKESKGNTAINTSCTSSNDKWWSADATWLSTATSADADGQSLLLALRDNIDKSLATLADAGKAADIKFLMWHQGEADRSKGSEYQTQLQQVIDYVRQYLVARTGNSAYSTLPVIIGGIKSGTSQYKAEVESAKQTIANGDANIYYVSTNDIPVNGLRADNLHFNAKGAEMLGKKVYDLIATNHLFGEYTYAEKEKSIFRPNISFDETTQEVTITPDADSEVTGADSYYTLDGTKPTSSSNKYTAAFAITESCTITAISIGSNGEESCTNKLEISLAPMPVVYDFANTTDNINAADNTKSRSLWYKDQTSAQGFRYVLKGNSKLRVLTYKNTGTFTQGTGLYLSGSNRAFAIEGLSDGDMVRIVHNGT